MENNQQKPIAVSYRQLKEDMEQITTKLSAEPNDSTIPAVFKSMIEKINQYSIPYALMMLSNEFIQVIIQIYFEELFNNQINTLLSSLLEVFNYEMFSEPPTVSIISQLKDLQINIPLTSPRKEITHIEKTYDSMRSLEFQWKMVKEFQKEDENIESNILVYLVERLDLCYKMVKDIAVDTPIAVIEYFNEYYHLLSLFKGNNDRNDNDNNGNDTTSNCNSDMKINEENLPKFINPNEMEVDEEFTEAKHKDNKNQSPQKSINANINANNNGLNAFIRQEDVSKIEIQKRTFFYINEKLKAEESIDIEFKNYHFPIPNHLFEEIKKQICGFLNSKGGRIYIGIGDNQIVKGLVLDYKSKDLIRNQLVNCTLDFFPKCRTNKIKIFFIPIKTKKQIYIKNLYVIKVIVRQGDQGRLYSVSSRVFWSYFRMPGQCVCLSANEIYDEIIKRNNDIIDINNMNDELIDDKVYDDPEPDIPLNDQSNDSKNHNNCAQIFEPQTYSSNVLNKHMKKSITVKLDNISKACTVKELDEVLKLTQYCSKKIFANENGLCLGWAFFEYRTEKDAVNAIDLLKNVELKGKKLGFQLRK